MKKVFCALLTAALILTSVPMVSASIDASENNLMNLFFEKNVNPNYYSAIFGSFISFDTATGDTGYSLRTNSNEDITSEISMLTRQFGVTEEELSLYVDSFISYFTDKPEEFELFISFVINTENLVLPMHMQESSLLQFKDISNYMINEYYGTIYAFNLISSINKDYHEASGDAMFYILDDELNIRDNVSDSIKCILNSNTYFNSFAMEKITDLVIFSSGCTETEKSNFYQFLISLDVVSMNMDDSSNEQDDAISTLYTSLASAYRQGNDYISEFNSYEAVANEYIPKIRNTSSSEQRKNIISESLSKAAEIKLKNTSVSSNTVSTIISDASYFEFSSLNALMVRNVLIDNGISVSSNLEFDINIIYPPAGFPEGFTIRFPSDVFTSLNKYHIKNIKIKSPEGDIVISRAGIAAGDFLSTGANFTVNLRRASAASIIPNMSDYAQGSPVLAINVSSGTKITDYIPRDVMYYGKDISGDTDNYATNNFYYIKSDKTRDHVSDYMNNEDYISFEIGNANYFVHIEGKLVEPSPGSIKPGNPSTGINTDTKKQDDKNDDTENETQEKEPEIEVNFNDVNTSHWASSYIYELASSGIVSGTGNGNFEPDTQITREQFTKMILESLNLYMEGEKSTFDDVDNDAWYSPYVACASESGIVKGIGENIFGIGKEITRQDMSVMVVRAAKSAGKNLTQLSDHEYNDYKKIADYALESMLILSEAGVITGFEDNTLRGDEFATRAQAAKIICTLLKVE